MRNLFENWRSYNKQMLAEQSKKYFDQLEEYLNKVFASLSVDPFEQLRKDGFKHLGSGAFRFAMAVPDNKPYVVKILYGLGQDQNVDMNKAEVDMKIQTKYSNILPKSYIRADDYGWIVVEKVEPITDTKKTDQFFPGWPSSLVVMKVLGLAKWQMKNNYHNPKEALRLALMQTEAQYGETLGFTLGDLKMNPLIYEIFDFIIEYDIAAWDLGAWNTGISEDGRFVILDYSIDPHIKAARQIVPVFKGK